MDRERAKQKNTAFDRTGSGEKGPLISDFQQTHRPYNKTVPQQLWAKFQTIVADLPSFGDSA